MIKYFSYFILTFCILYFLKNNLKNMDYPELMQTILILVSIYIIDLVFTFNNIKETFNCSRNYGTGHSCNDDCQCASGKCHHHECRPA